MFFYTFYVVCVVNELVTSCNFLCFNCEPRGDQTNTINEKYMFNVNIFKILASATTTYVVVYVGVNLNGQQINRHFSFLLSILSKSYRR